ncbi:putative methyltransferase-domain-containing protein [Boeremia exigua]|uniref:putative methyltransferase-domain-containing protein n=1 Tax=Boeremia exigua TaxID=749465 RepID=UPI001E8E8E7B|nr:putative methyltransferase-domain-containing protein [Boeremia exigua]KAH6643177.1 putative methyltransferase-domain-containing protein [Boeremia exigua]
MATCHTGPCLPPSSSLPPVRSLINASEQSIKSSLRGLQTLYCPLRLPVLPKPSARRKDLSVASGVSTPVPVDSGYVSQDEDEDDEAAAEEVTASIRADPFERTFATRWLTSLISRVEEMDFSEDARNQIVDDAAFILSSFSDSTNDEAEEALTRAFSFPTAHGAPVEVTLNDAPLTGADHTDVGLQSWGASIVLSSMLCASPARFNLTPTALAPRPTIIELGAGTGLVSLTLAKLLPTLDIHPASISATDYHPTVLANLQHNISTNFPPGASVTTPLSATALDWSLPPPDLAASAHLLIAADVVYAPQHAAWLRDCAAHLATPDGVFWLIVTIRHNGKFEGIPETVEDAFAGPVCPRDGAGRSFGILERWGVEKRRGVGRGDEVGYTVYRIGWA